VSTFLQLVQDLHRECGASGTAPTSVIGQTGEAQRLVRWIRDADLKVQRLWVNWKFRRLDYSQPTVQSQPTLPKPGNLAVWDLATFFIVPPTGVVGTDNEMLPAVEYEQVKREFLDTSEGQPARVIIMPDSSLKFEGTPDGAYTILADYYRKTVTMSQNTDVSIIPEDYHDVILGRALMMYGNFENGPEIKEQGQELYAEFLARLENDQLPNQNYSRYRTGGGFEVIAS
jgi:hypothetical protein